MKDSVVELSLKCSACARKVTRILESIDGIETAKVSLADQFVIVRHDPETAPLDTIKTVLRVAGYMIPKNQKDLFSYTEHDQEDSLPHAPLIAAAPVVVLDKSLLELSVQGMTCAACVGAIERHLKSLKGIEEVNVSLLLNSAKIRYDPDQIDGKIICEEIEDIGYSAQVTNQNKLDMGIFSVKGMTCAACVSSIENHLRSLQGVASADISLLMHSAKVSFDPTIISVETLISEVDDIGFEMTFDGYESHSDTALDMNENQFSSKQNQEIYEYRNLLLLSSAFAVPIFIIAMILPRIDSVKPILMYHVLNQLTVMGVVLWVLCTPVQFYVGSMFYTSAYAALKHGSSNMSVLVAIGTSSAYAFSFLALVLSAAGHGQGVMGAEHYFETSSTLITFVLLGKYLESIAKRQTSQALSKLIDMQPQQARVVNLSEDRETESGEMLVPTSTVKVGEITKVIRGEKIPLDGIIVKGRSSIEESMITGESMPQTRSVGDSVIGACINQENTIWVQVSRIGADSTLSQIVKLMENASMSKAPIQSYADKISSVFVPVVILIAVSTFVIWWGLSASDHIPNHKLNGQSPILFSLLFGISVMTVACPCALGLATPTAVMVGTGVGAKNGVLIKSGKALEVAHEINTIIFDKTGTLTKGQPEVTDVRVTREFQIQGMDDDSVIYLAASAERESEHPLARAIVTEAKKRSIQLANALNFNAMTGRGLKCNVSGKDLLIGNRAWMSSNDIAVDLVSEGVMQYLEDSGKTAICLSIDGSLAAVLGVADTLKPESKHVVKYLQNHGFAVWMVSGDNRRTAKAIGATVGLSPDNIVAEALPKDKLDKVKSLQKYGAKVAFVGDGINDSPALAQSDLGIAIGAGSDIAIEAAEMVLMSENLFDVIKAFDLSNTTFRRIKWNFLWALLFNTLGIPLAAGVLYPSFGVKLSPEFAALAMACSSLMVLSSSLLLNYYRPPTALRKYEKSQPRNSSPGPSDLKTPLLSQGNHVSSEVRLAGNRSDCCSCDECGLISEADIQALHQILANKASEHGDAEFTIEDVRSLPNLSLCSCSCSDCKCTRLPSLSLSEFP